METSKENKVREIKFRAWHKDQELMLTVECIDWVSKTCESDKIGYVSFKEGIAGYSENFGGYERTEEEYSCDLDEVILMQYTGLLDKNHNPIFEGDILKWTNERDWVVYFIENECGFYAIQNHGSHENSIKLGDQFNSFTVIGNIYENSELLKINDDRMELTFGSDLKLSGIKKITRINLDKKIFEEI